MLTIVRCTNCGETKGLNFKISIRHSSKFCKECHQYSEDKNEYIYCSYKCLIEHTTNLSTHKCKDYWQYIGGYTFNRKLKRVEFIPVSCPICLNGKSLSVKELFGNIRIHTEEIDKWKSGDSIINLKDRMLVHKIKR